VNAILAPVQPVLSVLQAPLPILSQLAGKPFTILDIAEQFGPLFGGSIGKDTRRFIKAAADLNALVTTVQQIGSTGMINLGDFSLTGSTGADLRKTGLKSVNLDNVPGSSSPFNVGDRIKAFVDQASAIPSQVSGNGTGAGMSFPILKNPMGILKLLTGQGDGLTLFEYDMPQLRVFAPIQIPIPIIPPILTGFFAGGIGAQVDFNFGFDTSGFSTGNPFDGFYVQDTIGGVAGARDPMEASIFGFFEVGAMLGGKYGPVTIAAGAAGGIFAEIGLNLNDPNNDGRVHLNELRDNLNRGVEWVFDLQGSLEAYLRAFIKIEIGFSFFKFTLVDIEKELFRITLLEFSIPKRGSISDAPLGEITGNDLVLNFSNAEDDNFRIAQDGSGVINVTARGRTQSFNPIGSRSFNRIRGNAGKGDDFVLFDSSLTLPVDIDGGDGNDRITYSGAGTATLRGGAGNDQLTGSTAADSLSGGDGEDKLFGEAGNDNLDGGAGNDSIFGGTGDDTIDGQMGDDEIDGESGNDTIRGGDGNDRILGGLDNDFIYGGAGNDSLNGGDGSDNIYGGSSINTLEVGTGDDRVDGGLGNDFIYGQDGNDFIDGGKSNDTIYGGAGNDVLYGNAGTDNMFGDAGDDLLIAGISKAGGDTGAVHMMYGGDGNDEIYGDIGQDTIYAGAGNDRLFGLAGNDDIRGEAGDDTIYAGAGSDLVVGGWGRDSIYAGNDEKGDASATNDVNVIFGDMDGINRDTDPVASSSTFDPSLQADLIYGDQGNDFIYAGYGNDAVYGLKGSDWIEGGWQADVIYAASDEQGANTIDRNTIYGDSSIPLANQKSPAGIESHADRIYGDLGEDFVYAGQSSDTVYTLAGNDTVYGGDGNDFIQTDIGDDVVYGEAGEDNLVLGILDNPAIVGSDKDIAYGGAGNDRIVGYRDDDFLVGGSGDDELLGGTGSDVLWGGADAIAASAFNRTAVNDFDFPTNFPGAAWSALVSVTQSRIVPRALAGLSVEGTADDGNDRLFGDMGNDWLFGGGSDDQLFAGAGIDFADGGAGSDRVEGGEGDDVLRGGGNDDIILGGDGIDQLFGDSGSDRLFGDASRSLTSLLITNSLFTAQFDAGQHLFGGDDIDYLYGYSGTTTTETNLVGEEFHGGAGGDWIYGSNRSDLFYGEGGNDTIQGDALSGPNYTESSERARIGGSDVFYGGTGEDRLYGGGGDDQLWGGGDSDWLEGQNGVDTLYGGSGIDMLYLDSSPTYTAIPLGRFEVFDGHKGNALAGDTPDDNATDILLVEGTDSNDKISIGQTSYDIANSTRKGSRMSVVLNGITIVGEWRSFNDPADLNGKSLVEQIRISGLGGNDSIDFLSTPFNGINPLDVSDLTERSDDWVGVIDGGPGNDTLKGTGARDRIDGGLGDDVIYGFAGDDQLWGDGGPGLGDSGNNDVVYGGQGDDDILGGQGTNSLHAWSVAPDLLKQSGLNAAVSLAGFASMGIADGARSVLNSLTNPPSWMIDGSIDLPETGKINADWSMAIQTQKGPRVIVVRQSDTVNNTTRAELIADFNAAFSSAGVPVTASLNTFRLRLTASESFESFAIGPFGVYVDDFGRMFYSDGDFNSDGKLDSDPIKPARRLEDTGLNRMLGGPKNDQLYGGTGLDFMYGAGSNVPGSPDILYDRTGGTFDTRGALAGEEWKAYAKNTNKVWYYGGTNRDDVINVDYVTEPGVLQGRHLITRLTNNNGIFTFDAQVQLDFSNWSSDDSFYGLALTGSDSVPGTIAYANNGGRSNGQLTNEAVIILTVDNGDSTGGVTDTITIPVSLSADNTNIRDLVKDINDLLPATLKNKVLARSSGDKISFTRPTSLDSTAASIIVSYANNAAQTELFLQPGQTATRSYVGSNGLQSLLPPEGDFQAIIIDALDGNDQVTIGPTVLKSVWTDGGRGDDIIKYVAGKPILIDQGDSQSGTVRNDTLATSYSLGTISTSTLFTGLTIDNPVDVDWFGFTLAATPTAQDYLRLTSISPNDRVSFGIYDAIGVPTSDKLYSYTSNTEPQIALSGLAIGTQYRIKVETDRISTAYELQFVTGVLAGTLAQPVAIPLIAGLGSIVGIPAKPGVDVFYSFMLTANAQPTDSISLNAFDAESPVTLTLTDSTGVNVLDAMTTIGIDSPASISLKELRANVTYRLKISSSGSARYELVPRIATIVTVGPVTTITYGTGSLDLSSQSEVYRGNALTNPLDRNYRVRKDVLIGGAGNDTLQGGPGEDWIFGGTGNDVLSGGYDSQAGDLLWGEEGDDIYQVLTDQLPATKAAQRRVGDEGKETFIPTYTDRFDGGSGIDQVLYLGGDLDVNGRAVPDNVAIR